MFESLSDRLQGVFRSLRGEGRLTEETVEAALREIRMALLEADVNFKVVKAFIDRVRDKAVDKDVLKSLTPAQQVVRDRSRRDAGAVRRYQGGLPPTQQRPRVVLMLGLQGSGKTTTSGQAGAVADQAGEASDPGLDRRAGVRRRSSSSTWSRNRPACGCTIRPAKWIRSSAPRAR